MQAQLRILFADDDPDDLFLLQEGLLKVAPPHTLHYVNHGADVLAAVRERPPDLIFLDYNMPGYDGTECLKMIKSDPALQDIPVVMYSTSSARFSLDECYKLGAARYLLKPVNYAGIFRGLQIIFELYNNKQLIRPYFQQFLIDTYNLG
jgi:CheY-like chemotaxis protein